VEHGRTWKKSAEACAEIIQFFIRRYAVRNPSKGSTAGDTPVPACGHLIPASFAKRCIYLFVPDWRLSAEANNLRKLYVDRFGIGGGYKTHSAFELAAY